jgi:murein L,D-transpeptidase YcbB/YkuD
LFAHVGVSLIAFAAALGGASAAAEPRRPDFLAPPAAVALTGLEREPAAKTLAQTVDLALPAPETPPLLVALETPLRLKAEEADPLDLAWALLADEQRQLALALENWKDAPEVARSPERRRLRAALAAAYMGRQLAPFWTDANGWTEAARPTIARLRAAGEDGLDLRGVAIPSEDRAIPTPADELGLSEAVATYAMQARGARLEPERISRLIGSRRTLPDPAQAVQKVAAAGFEAGQTLQGFNPPHYGYQQLREKLVELRSQRAGLDARDDRLAAVSDILPQTDALPPSKARRQRAAAGNSRLEAEIIANMERWRWLPRDMGETRVEVNIPDFELAVVRNGMVAHRTRVIVGKEETPTPIFSDAMQYIIVNPYWNVPQSIIQKEMLPKGGVETLEGRGFKVSYRNGQLVVRQPPGEKNALGRIKFVFPNDFAVYMHDTPTRNLFSESHRAFSHGCMRVEDPFSLAEAVLGPGSGWSEERVRRLVGGNERYINLSKPLPVHIQYFTAYVDEGGRLVQRADLYGYSARVRRALGLGG